MMNQPVFHALTMPCGNLKFLFQEIEASSMNGKACDINDEKNLLIGNCCGWKHPGRAAEV